MSKTIQFEKINIILPSKVVCVELRSKCILEMHIAQEIALPENGSTPLYSLFSWSYSKPLIMTPRFCFVVENIAESMNYYIDVSFCVSFENFSTSKVLCLIWLYAETKFYVFPMVLRRTLQHNKGKPIAKCNLRPYAQCAF